MGTATRGIVCCAALYGLAAAVMPRYAPQPIIAPRTDSESGRVDVGGFRLFYRRAGRGVPTVVFEAGRRYYSSTWDNVWPAVAGFTQVLVYDRAGLGASDAGPEPQTSRAIAAELKRLLDNSRIPGPYVLVGHSFGGLHIRVFRDMYPGLVAGMALIDSNHPEQHEGLQRRLSLEDRRIFRERSTPPPNDNQVIEASLNEVRQTRPLGDIPLAVLAHGISLWSYLSPDGTRQAHHNWLDLQRDLAGLSSDSEFGVARQSGHFIQQDEPELVIRAVRRVVMKARTRQSQRVIFRRPA